MIKPINATSSRKEYKIQDMLGSTRLAVELGGVITGQYDYAPFGKVMWKNGLEKRLSFIDKEKDEESGDHNFGVRQYDDVSGRFMAIDPLWEKYRSLSPYQYSNNNPLILKDPSGKTFGGGNFGPNDKVTTEASGHLTTSKARSADDPPRGSSHVEESFKESLRPWEVIGEGVADLTALIGAGIGEAWRFYDIVMVENQKRKEAAEIAMVPAFVSVSFGGTTTVGTGGGATANQTLFLRGEAAGTIVGTNTIGVGGGWDMSGGFSFTIGHYIPNSYSGNWESGITPSMLTGRGHTLNIGGAVGGAAGLTAGFSSSSSGTVITSGVNLGASPISTVVSGSYLRTETNLNE